MSDSHEQSNGRILRGAVAICHNSVMWWISAAAQPATDGALNKDAVCLPGTENQTTIVQKRWKHQCNDMRTKQQSLLLLFSVFWDREWISGLFVHVVPNHSPRMTFQLFVTVENHHSELIYKYSGTLRPYQYKWAGAISRAWRSFLWMCVFPPTSQLAVLYPIAAGAEGRSLVFSRAMGMDVCCERARALAVRHQCDVHVHGNRKGCSRVYMFGVWMSSLRSIEQTETHRTKVHTYIHLLYLYAKQLLPAHQYSWVPAAETHTDAGTCQTRIQYYAFSFSPVTTNN